MKMVHSGAFYAPFLTSKDLNFTQQTAEKTQESVLIRYRCSVFKFCYYSKVSY